jgi:hypothetical protein
LLDALRARHAYATTDGNLRVICRVAMGDEVALGDGLCGDVLAAPAVETAVAVTLDVADDDEPGVTYQLSTRTPALKDRLPS